MATTVSPAFHTQVAVIGAGVVGLAIARALAQSGKEVILLEKTPTIASETSSRNSEVIHAGIYYPKDSYKAKLCVSGKHSLYDYIQSRNVPYKKCGKLIVATTLKQVKRDLPLIQEKARNNGVNDLKILSKEDVHILEPQVKCFGGLWSPSTGVLDSHSFFMSLQSDAEKSGAQIVFNTSVDDAYINQDKKVCLKADDTWIECDNVVNSAGLWASQIACLIHKDTIYYTPPKTYYAKGNYFRLQGHKLPFQHLIYPVPVPGGLGVHATIDWSGSSVKFGPDVEWLPLETMPNRINLHPDPRRGDQFYHEIRNYWPNLPDEALVPDYSGIRPKLNHPSIHKPLGFRDLQIDCQKKHGIPGLVHLFGIESPGLTSSMAIAQYVLDNLVTDR
jgi:L-2-hydroxyglutarate oxidase LhgO